MQQNQQMKVAEASGSRTSIGADSTQDQRDASTPNAPNAPNSPSVVHGVPDLARVKPLKWQEREEFAIAGSRMLWLQVRKMPTGWKWRIDIGGGGFVTEWQACDGMDDGKQKASAAYRAALFAEDGPLEPATDDTAALTAHVAALRDALAGVAMIIPPGAQVWINEAGDTWEFSNGNPYLNDPEADQWSMVADVHAALAATPEQSLAALRAEAVESLSRDVAHGFGLAGHGLNEADAGSPVSLNIRQAVERVRNEAIAEAKGAAWEECTNEAVHQVEEIAGNLSILDELCSREDPDEMALALQRLRNEAAAEALDQEAEDQESRAERRSKHGPLDDFRAGAAAARRNVAEELRIKAQRLREAARP